MTLLAEQGASCSAAESGSLSKLRAGKRCSNKLGDAVTIDVWKVEECGVGTRGRAPAPESFTHHPCTSARKPGTSPASSLPTPATMAHDCDDGIISSHDCVKPGVIRAETGLGESEPGHQLPHNSLISTNKKGAGRRLRL
jgi:hypothetical protein